MIERWALISGLKGDLDTYELIQKDLKKTPGNITLFVLGDMIGPEKNCNKLLHRLINPKSNDLQPWCIYGWWEEQILLESGYRGNQRAEALRINKGEEVVKSLINAVDKSFLDWIASLQFGFVELDCGLIHGSSKDVGDDLTLDTPPLTLLDRLTRLQVNRLFTARSTHQFHLELTEGIVHSEVQDLAGNHKKEQKVPQKAVIGVGAGKNYTLYDVGTDNTQFVRAGYQLEKKKNGFGLHL